MRGKVNLRVVSCLDFAVRTLGYAIGRITRCKRTHCDSTDSMTIRTTTGRDTFTWYDPDFRMVISDNM